MILSNSRAPGGVPWAELKSEEHLSADHQQNRDIWCRFTYHLQFWIMNFYLLYLFRSFRSFIAGTAPSFSIKRCAYPASNWALFIKRSSTNTLEKLRCCPGKTKCIHCLRNAVFFGKLNNVIFPLQPKTHFFRDILPEHVPCRYCRMKHVDGRFCSRAGRCVHGRVLPGEMPIQGVPPFITSWRAKIKKKLSETGKKPGRVYLAQTYSVIHPNRCLKLWPCLAWESNSLTV